MAPAPAPAPAPVPAASAAERTLADIVTTTPAVAPVLERLGLDYCCGGSERLDTACARLGLDPSAVLGELASAGANGDTAPPAWAALGPSDLVDHLEATHHVYLKAAFPRLAALATKVAQVHGARHPELAEVRDTYDALRADLEPHLRKEEQILFPMIRQLAASPEGTAAPQFHCGSLRNPISVMLVEHDRAGDLLARLRSLTGGYTPPADGCASYQALYDGLAELEADTHLHVHKENNLLFPAVVALEGALAGS